MRKEKLKRSSHPELGPGSINNEFNVQAQPAGFRIKSGMTGQAGRSMVEMLGVLAVAGLLSVMAFFAFRLALNKAKANAIIHDGRMVWAEALAWQTVPKRNDWIDSRAANESGKQFAVMRDIKDNNYIKVEGVEEEVCEQMLLHQQEGSLLFLTTDYEDLTTCPEGENAIVMAFDGVSGKPAECVNQKGCQDLYSDAFYCDESGHCQECDAAISVVNAAGDGCECNSAVALTCDDGNGHTWCCGQDEYGNEQICGKTPGECKITNGQCIYTMTQLTQALHSNCSYRITDTVIDATKNTHSISMTIQQRCNDDQYCYLAYEDENCGILAEGNRTGLIYGICMSRTQRSTQCPLSHTGGGLTQDKGCPIGKYCYLKWADDSCGVEAEGNATGKLYGTCIQRDSNNAQCPMN